jgi:hypothetical protein
VSCSSERRVRGSQHRRELAAPRLCQPSVQSRRRLLTTLAIECVSVALIP